MIRKTVTLFLLTLYLSSVVTIDLHHNHAAHLPGTSDPAVVHSVEVAITSGAHHAPCPVQQFSLSHAPVSTVELSTIEVALVRLCTDCFHVDSRLALTPSERAPPLA
ncbi:hypothetical protein KQI63_12370 [bacterium]|nr:hypothetical protein [bacterium]